MVDALNRPEKAQYHTIEFLGSDPSLPFGMTNWDTTIDKGGTVFNSHPALELEIPANRGTFGEDMLKVKVKLDAVTSGMLDPMTRGTPFAKTIVVVREIIEPARIGDSGSDRVVFRGQVFRTRRNIDGKRDLCLVECRNEKSLLDIKMGFQINPHCVWRLNGVGCNESTHGPSGYLTRFSAITIDGKKVTINDAGLLFDLPGTKSWTRGFIQKNGASIGIQFYDKVTFDGVAAKEFILVKQPPEEWESGTVQFFPGCVKDPEQDGGCGAGAWDNLEGFGGSGRAIPAHNPISENPA